ncbi:MAG TPA: hypothetical protein VF866_04395 [Xanthobacteraceae bacterium]
MTSASSSRFSRADKIFGLTPDNEFWKSWNFRGLDHPNLLTTSYPTVMTPAFAVPLSLILHGLSLWQLRRRSRTQSAVRPLENGIAGAH